MYVEYRNLHQECGRCCFKGTIISLSNLLVFAILIHILVCELVCFFSVCGLGSWYYPCTNAYSLVTICCISKTRSLVIHLLVLGRIRTYISKSKSNINDIRPIRETEVNKQKHGENQTGGMRRRITPFTMIVLIQRTSTGMASLATSPE